MSDEAETIKCPICGTSNPAETEKCSLCMTQLAVDPESKKISVIQPKDSGDVYSMIDLEDSQTRKELEQLTLIPGVTKRKALYLYRSGITSLEDFVEKAFHGDRHDKKFARIVTNKFILEDMKKGRGQAEEDEETVTCTSCGSATVVEGGNCKICGHEVEKEIESIEIADVSETLSGAVEEIFGELGEDDDFAMMSDEMKLQVASILDSDELDSDDISTVVDSLGDEFKEIGIIEEKPEEPAGSDEPEDDGQEETPKEDASAGEIKPAEDASEGDDKPSEDTSARDDNLAEEASVGEDIPVEASAGDDKPVEATQDETPVETTSEPPKGAEEKKEEEPAPEQPKSKAERKKDILLRKIKEWYNKGYDVSGLYPLIDGDMEIFKDAVRDMLKSGKRKE